MAIPNFNSNGILPEGIYEATLEEIKDFFCSYGDKERRKNLLNSLCKYIEDVKKHDVEFYICIDGSYVTKKEYPGDLDVLIVYDFEYNNKEWKELVCDEVAKFKYKGLQILPAFLDSYGEEELIDFAQDVKDNYLLRKGIIKVIL
nr:MAG TPA: hypothetical protein [Caudoviricetes sp.]